MWYYHVCLSLGDQVQLQMQIYFFWLREGALSCRDTLPSWQPVHPHSSPQDPTFSGLCKAPAEPSHFLDSL